MTLVDTAIVKLKLKLKVEIILIRMMIVIKMIIVIVILVLLCRLLVVGKTQISENLDVGNLPTPPNDSPDPDDSRKNMTS